MTENTSRISRNAKVSCAAMIAFCTLLGPVKSYAQSDQVIVMVCTLAGHRDTITLDLVNKTVAVDKIIPNPGFPDVHEGPFRGIVTQITDQQINFNYVISTETETVTLNRYTGDLSSTTSNDGFTSRWSCQKQQKQF